MERLKLLLATAGGLGLSPVAPGTFGTLAGVLLAYLLSGTGTAFPFAVAGCVVLLYVVGRPLARWAERRSPTGDPGWFVLDEVLGYLVCVAWTTPPSLLALVCAFVFFRVFDVLKPPPVRQLERVPGADGILLDDLAAGFLGLGCMALARTFLLDEAHWVGSAPW
jgi:phosphatidylglycerophosphatase A